MRGKDYITEYLKKTPIQNYYSGKTIFITGGTGFVGKLIVERLMCHCYDIDKIYLLIRPKKDKNIQGRLNDLLNDALYAKLEEGWKNKIVAVEGKLGEANLGLNKRDRKLLIDNVDVVFHSGATVRFDEKLKIALKVNVIGTFDIINLCKEMKHLKAFVHVSTAFANCIFGLNIQEKFYKSGMTLEEAQLLSNVDEDTLEMFKLKLLLNWPNTYSFTKAIAEEVILKSAKELPVIIFRPGILLGTSGKHSVLGYTDSFFGPSGLLAAVGTGLLRLLKISKNTRCNMLPADFCANGIISSAWDISQRFEPIPPIINYVPPNQCNVVWGKVINLWLRAVYYIPLSNCLWYPCMTLTSCKYDYVFRNYFLHILPSIIMDLILKITGNKLSILTVNKKIEKLLSLLDFFVSTNWVFELTEMNKVISHMSVDDRNLFYSDLSTLKWSSYSTVIVYGIRKNLLKEKASVLESRKKLKILKTLHYGLKYFIISMVALIVWIWLQRLLKIR